MYDLYGLAFSDIERAKEIVERALGIAFVAHESGYHCGDYYRCGTSGGEHFVLQRNFDSLENEWTEAASQDQPLLLYVNETHRCEDIEKLLSAAGAVRLRHREMLP